eukprot:6175764-Pleurochrysis_carterae.AAC.1
MRSKESERRVKLLLRLCHASFRPEHCVRLGIVRRRYVRLGFGSAGGLAGEHMRAHLNVSGNCEVERERGGT